MNSGYVDIMRSLRNSPTKCLLMVNDVILLLRNAVVMLLTTLLQKDVIIKTSHYFKKLKSTPWKDVDEKCLNKLIPKKEEDLLHNILKSASITSNNYTIIYKNTQDVSDCIYIGLSVTFSHFYL